MLVDLSLVAALEALLTVECHFGKLWGSAMVADIATSTEMLRLDSRSLDIRSTRSELENDISHHQGE
jgi:hypothetical protein